MLHTLEHYAPVHAQPNGPGDGRPTAEDIINDENLVGKLNGVVVFMTGGTSGLGKESARALRLTGAQVYISARDAAKGERVATELSTEGPYPSVKVIGLDLGSLNSIRKGAADFPAQESKLNIFIANAGIMACPPARTIDAFESQFGTNHLGHFLLFNLLKPALLSAATPQLPSRLVFLSSTGHRGSDIRPDIGYDFINFGKYDAFVAYGQSKTANILFANEVERRYGSDNLHGLSVHPGIILDTELARNQDGGLEGLRARLAKTNPGFEKVVKSAGQGAATQVWAAVAESLKGKGDLYLEDVQISPRFGSGGPAANGYLDYVYNEEHGKRLWEDSMAMVGLKADEKQ
jgi:NAD(P)-dependent dehydrogenase (short-subunit alcohol dehydrogenase family)